MISLKDRVARISALRPLSTSMQALGSSASERTLPRSERLAHLLAGVCQMNRYGTHLLVRREFHEPPGAQPGPRLARLLVPEAPEEASDLNQWLFLDTETTGLSGGTGTYAFLVGVAWWQGCELIVEQLFMRDHTEEPSLLFELSQRLAQRRILVTFNGKSFDWPLLETRYRMARAVTALAPLAHLDLLYPARQLWQLRIGSVRLVELERHVLARERRYDIPSEWIPGRYFDFLRGGPPEPLVDVFRHNQMDLRGLAGLAARIVSILEHPVEADGHPLELYGLSRLLERRGEAQPARCLYERALNRGLPAALDRIARGELARLAKRQRDFQRAISLWKELLGESADGLDAYEQLAMYYEHRARDLERAAAVTREAVSVLSEALRKRCITEESYCRWNARLTHRLSRLTKRNSRYRDA